MRSFTVCNPQQVLLDDETKEDEVGGACSTHRDDKKLIHDFSREI
jgi:hypothetical protein